MGILDHTLTATPAEAAPTEAGTATENIDLVREGLDAFLGGDFDRALELADPDLVTFRAPPLPDARTYRGHRGLLEAYADWTVDFSEFEMSAEEFLAKGDLVVVEVLQRARGQRSGAEVQGRFWFVYTVDAGLVARLDVYSSREQALEESGLAADLPTRRKEVQR